MSAEWHSVTWPLTIARGRIEWSEEHTPVDPDAFADRVLADIRRDQRTRRMRTAAGLMTVAVLAFAALAIGCATAPARPEVLVLPEVAGSVSAKAIGALVGQEPKAASVPATKFILVFNGNDAKSPCLIVHEARHKYDEARLGTTAFLIEYERQYRACRATGATSAFCVRDGMELERVAYQAQHDCMRANR